MKKLTAFALLKPRDRKSSSGSIALGARRSPLPGDEHRDEHEADRERRDHLGARPADGVRADEAPGQAEHAAAGEQEPAEVELWSRTEALREPGERERSQYQADRHVEPEDPVPVEAVDDGAADDRPCRNRETGDTAPEPDRGTALLGRKCGADQRQGQRHHDRSRGALKRACRDQRVHVRGQRRGRGCSGEAQ
jgi:hypothetical protein